MVYLRILMVFFCLPALVSREAFAGYDYKFETHSVKSGQIESEMMGKLERGATNVLLGWTEVLRTPTEWSSNPAHGTIKAFTIGVPYGVLRAVGRTGIGVYEMATFYVPQKPIFYPLEGDVI